MKHLDLFSGIGGFALAVDTVWPGSEHIFCDNDPFCQQVLKKHWPDSKIYGDIKSITKESAIADTSDYRGREPSRGRAYFTGFRTGAPGNLCDLLTGGFPCQPFSHAGRRQGTEDDRYLWPEMFRIIRDFKPSWVVAENVRGLATWNDGLVLEQVCTDLESEGYEVQPFIIPAVAVNAPHRRDRIWIVAHRSGDRRIGEGQAVTDENGQPRFEETRELEGGLERPHSNDSYTPSKGLEGSEWQIQQRARGRPTPSGRGKSYSWHDNWLEVATELCGVDDGLPAGVDRFKLTKSAHRQQRLKSLGNAIVPQVAMEIFKAIKAI